MGTFAALGAFACMDKQPAMSHPTHAQAKPEGGVGIIESVSAFVLIAIVSATLVVWLV